MVRAGVSYALGQGFDSLLRHFVAVHGTPTFLLRMIKR